MRLLFLLALLAQVPQPIRVTGTLASDGATVLMDNVGAYGQVSVDLEGTVTGIVHFEGLGDGSSTWRTMPCFDPTLAATSQLSSTAAAGHYLCAPSGFRSARVRVAGWTSGTVTVTMRAVGTATVPLPPVLGVAVTQPVTISNFPSTQAVTGTFWQATQPVSGTFWQATQPVSGTVGITGTVPVSGTFWPATQPVSGTFWQATQPISATSLPLPTGAATSAGIDGLQGTLNGIFTNTEMPYLAVSPIGSVGPAQVMQVAGFDEDSNTDVLHLDSSGNLRVTVSGATTATFPAAVRLTDGTTFYKATTPSDTQPVSGTFWQATQPVSLASVPSHAVTNAGTFAVQVTSAPTTAVTGTFWQATQPVSGTFWQATQPVSGTVTANAGTNLNTSALALDATLTGGTQTTRVTDGTNTATVKAASTAAVATDKALVVAVSPNNTVPVSGTFWQTTQPVSLTSTTLTANAVVSTVNSSTATLGIGGVFTGTSEDVTEYADIRVTVFADQPSATDGLSVQQSSNGTNWDVTDVFTIAAGAGRTFAFGSSAKFFRLVYTNGGTAQGAFRLQTIFHKTYHKPSTNRPTDARTNETDTEENTSLLMGYNGTTWDRLRSTTANGLAVDVTRVPANASVNQTQVNGVAVSVDRGTTDTGTQRVTTAQDATYAASTTAKTATASGTAAFFEICGSATKTIRIQRIVVSGTVATAAIYGDVQIRKTSSAGTGNTATTLTATPYDSNAAAATATAKFNTVLPTGGNTLVGNIFSQTLFFPITGTVTSFQPQLLYVWRDLDAESPVLRGTSQCLTAGFGTAPGNVPTLSVSVAWTEK